MKRFDEYGRKLTNNIIFPFTFSLDMKYLSSELADKETNGYPKEDHAPMSHSSPLFPQDKDLVKRRHTYELYAMIIHQGYSSQIGHYYCLIRHSTGQWIKFDDEKITLIEENEKLLQLSQKAYICFYERKWIFDGQNQSHQETSMYSSLTGILPRKSTRMLEKQESIM